MRASVRHDTQSVRDAVRRRRSGAPWMSGPPPVGLALDAWLLANAPTLGLEQLRDPVWHGPTHVLAWGARWPLGTDFVTVIIGVGSGIQDRPHFRVGLVFCNGRGGQRVGQRKITMRLEVALAAAEAMTRVYRREVVALRGADREVLTAEHLRAAAAARLA